MSAKSNAAAQTVAFTAVNGAPIEVIAPAVEQVIAPAVEQVIAPAVEQVTVAATQAPAAEEAGPTIAQQIAVAVARAEKAMMARLMAAQPAPAATPAAHADAVQPEPASTNIEQAIADMQLPSARRVLVGFILGVAAAGAVGYGIGMLLSYALAGILTLTATAWIAFALTVVAWIIAIYAGWKLGTWAGGKVFASVVLPEGLASQSFASVSNAAGSAKETVSGWFTSSKNVVAAKVNEAQTVVTGAFTKAAA